MSKKKKAAGADAESSKTSTSQPGQTLAHPGSEREADQQREGGPRYHGTGWEQAAEDEQKGRIAEPDSADTRSELEAADEEIADPGTRGAVLGKGGVGIVERDQPDDPAGTQQEREKREHGATPPESVGR